MAGGTWDPASAKVLPGFYMNFVAAALAAIKPGERGVVVLPVKAHWGPVNQFVTITSEQGIIDNYTQDETGGATAYTTLRLALLGKPKKILAYRVADPTTKAKGTITLQDTNATPANVMTLTTKYESARAFKVTVAPNVLDSTKKDLKLYDGTTLLYTFKALPNVIQDAVNQINADAGNKWVDAAFVAAGTGTLKDVTGQAFTGGNSGLAVPTSEYTTTFLTACETQEFNLLSLDGVADSAVHTSVASWIQRVRDNGKNVMAVLGGAAADDTAADAVSKATTRSAGFNHEGIVNVGVGVILDGVNYSSAQVAPYVAALIGGQRLSEATTYAPTPFDDVTRKWTKDEQEAAVNGGVFLFIHDGKIVKPLKGINTLVTLRQGQNDVWKKIRAIRVMDAFNSDLLKAAEDNYIGKVNNTEDGRLALIDACKAYMRTMAKAGVIEAEEGRTAYGFDVYLDPDYYGASATLTPLPDQVYLKWEARLTDVMEQIFSTFIVK